MFKCNVKKNLNNLEPCRMIPMSPTPSKKDFDGRPPKYWAAPAIGGRDWILSNFGSIEIKGCNAALIFCLETTKQ